MNIQMIPLNRLTPCPANVRKSGTGIGIAELAASIAAHGLLQNLQVRSGKGGKFEVVAGARRLAALGLLAKQKTIAKTAGIACNILDDENAGEISLAENTIRLPMHPADQFTAFHALAATGKGPEEIAGRFGCTAAVVRQRLKLATVSPRLLDLYRAAEMDLDQLMAFTVSDNHGSQEAAWFEQPCYSRTPSGIRRTLTSTQVEAGDPRARFVGLEAYTAAGGGITRDLFQPEHEGYLTDPALLDRLAAEKLDREAAKLRAEGWGWTQIIPDIDYAALRGFGRIAPTCQPPGAEQAEELDRLSAAYEALIEEYGEDPEPAIAQQMEDLSEQIDVLSAGCVTWQPEDMARAGVIISIGRDGLAAIECGLQRPEDRQEQPAAPKADTTPDGNAPSPAPASLSDRLIEDLTAHRTAALRTLLADDWLVALAAVVQAMALPVFYSHSFGTGTCLDLRANSADLRRHAEGIADSPAAVALDAHHAAWLRRLPETAETLWDWLLAQTPDTLTGLLAYCAACTVSAVRKPQDRADAAHLRHADQLAAALHLDMTRWWQPTVAGYLGRVSKARILEAVTEGVSKGAADNLAKLKKDALAARAEERLAGTGWLPTILREPVPVSAAAVGPGTAFSEAA